MAVLLDPVVLWAARLVLAALFGAAAIMKLRAIDEFVGVVHNYRLLPKPLVRPVAYGLPPLEAAIALGLLIEPTRALAATLAAGLLVVFALAMALNLRRGRIEIDCGCFASSLKQRIGWSLVGRNLVLAALALLAIAPAAPARPLGWLDLMTSLAATLCALLLYVAFTALRSLAPPARPTAGDGR